MATFTITAPDGHEYDVTAPESASQDDVLAYAKANYHTATAPSSVEDNQGNWLERAGQSIDGAMKKAAPYLGAAQKLQDIVSPGSGIPEMAQNAVMSGFNKTGEAVSSGLGYLSGKINPNLTPGQKTGADYSAAAVGDVIANLPMFLMSGESVEGKLFEPNIPPGRAPAVSAAAEAGVPLSRAEKTGGRFITGLENQVEKTPLGGVALASSREASDAAMQAYADRLHDQMGTPKDKFDVGFQAKPAMEGRASAMNKTRDEMFKAIPDNVSIPLHEYQKIGDTISQELSGIRPLARDAEVSRFASDAQNPYGSTGEGVTGGPEVKGVTTRTPETIIPGTNIIREHGSEQPAANQPYTKGDSGIIQAGEGPPFYTSQRTPDVKVPGTTEYGAQYKVEPEEKFAPKSNYADVKALRETLQGKIDEALNAGNAGKARQFGRLKSALDKDIQNFASAPTTPLDSLTAQEFKSTYGKANAFSGAYKQLFKGDLADAVRNAPPEKILDMVFQKNNETAIKQFHALVGDEAFQLAKKKWVSNLLDSPNVSQALSEKKIDPGTLNAILSGPEQEALRKYGLVQGIRKTVGSLQGTQGSARSNIQNLSYGGLGGGIVASVTGHPGVALAGVGQFAVPYAAGKALASKAATEGLSYRIPGALSSAALASFVDKFTTKDNQ